MFGRLDWTRVNQKDKSTFIIYIMEQLILEFARDGMASTCGHWWVFVCDSWRRLALSSSSWWTLIRSDMQLQHCVRGKIQPTLCHQIPPKLCPFHHACVVYWNRFQLDCAVEDTTSLVMDGWLWASLVPHSITFWELLGLGIWYILFFTLPLLLN